MRHRHLRWRMRVLIAALVYTAIAAAVYALTHGGLRIG